MTITEPIKVLLADDHPVVRQGLIQVLQVSEKIEIVGEAGNGEDAIRLCRERKPDIIIIDIQMDGMGGIEATGIIRRQNPDVVIVGLSTFPQAEVVNAMMTAGANGYLLKDISSDELIEALLRLNAGETVFSPDLEKRGSESISVSGIAKVTPSDFNLGPQQKRVLMLMTKGLTNPEIAEHLGISTPTARYHVSAILQKLDVSNRAEAVALAARDGLVNESDI